MTGNFKKKGKQRGRKKRKNMAGEKIRADEIKEKSEEKRREKKIRLQIRKY